MTENHIRVVYDGPAVDDGEMAIGQLAPSLLAFGKLVEALDLFATGESGRVRVMVRADPRVGSFDIGLSLDFIHSVKAWLLSPEGEATATLVGLLGISVKDGTNGLIQVVRWLNGRRVNKKTTLVDGNVLLEIEGSERIVPAPVARAIEDVNARQQLERFTEPLREDGVNFIRFNGDGGIYEEIAASEAPAFIASASSDPTSQARFRATYQIKRLYFERGKKWRLSNGAQTILAEIADEGFWARVEAAEVSFSADDYLVCEVRMDQWMSAASGLKTEYVVERVVEHIPAPKQDRFPGT
jgi:hypothetical protein